MVRAFVLSLPSEREVKFRCCAASRIIRSLSIPCSSGQLSTSVRCALDVL